MEIVSLLKTYLDENTLTVERLGAGIEWYDAGTHDALLEAGHAVQRLQKGGELFGSPDSAAFRQGWSSGETLENVRRPLGKTTYGSMLGELIKKAVQPPTVAPIDLLTRPRRLG